MNRTNLCCSIRRVIFCLLVIFLSSPSFANSGYIDSLIKVLPTTTDPVKKAVLYNELSWELAPTDFNGSLLYAKKALALANGKSPEEVATAYNRIGGAYDLHGHYDEAIENYRLCADLRKSLKDSSGYSNALLNIGAVYYYMGAYSRALDFYQRAETIKNKINDIKGRSQVLNNIGLIYRVQKKYKQAIKTFEFALTLKEEMNDVGGQINVLSNIGIMHLNLKHCGDALKYFQQAQQLVEKFDINSELPATLANLGFGYKCAKKYGIAEKYFSSARNLLAQTDDHNTMAFCLNGLAELKYETKRYAEAISILNKGIEEARLVGRKEIISEMYLLRSNSYKKLNLTSQAFDDFQNYIIYRDSIFSTENTRQLNEIELLYESEKKQKEIERLSHASTLMKKNTRNKELQRNWFISLFIGIFGILLLVLIAFVQKNRSNKVLNQKAEIIEDALQEKEVLIREIHHRVKNNLQIITGLLELQNDTSPNEGLTSIVEEAKGRIKSMSIIHEMLYQSEDIKNIDLKDYTSKLVETIELGFSSDENRPQKTAIITNAYSFNIDTIIPLGLILNELVSNAYKYGFKNRVDGMLTIQLTKLPAENWELSVRDNGPGMPENQDNERFASFGLKLVRMLCRQLEGSMEYKNNQGAEFIITFKERFKS